MQADRLGRAFEAIRLIAASAEMPTASQVARSLQFPLSSTHDLLRSLTSLDLVENEDGHYALGPAALALSLEVLGGITVRTRARRHLIELADRTGEAVYLAAPSGRRLIYVDRALGDSRVTIHIRLGESLHLHSTAVGKLFAALDPAFRGRLWEHRRPALTERTMTSEQELTVELERIAREGVSVSRGESFPGILGLAVPVWAADGTLAAAIHVSASEAAVDEAGERALLDAMREAARRVMSDLGTPDPAGTGARKPGPDER